MKISQIFKNKNKVVSLEIFPPKKQEAFENVGEMLGELKKLNPDYISVTCGAGGSSNRNKTIELASMLKRDFEIEAMAHMTCISSTEQSVMEELNAAKAEEIENILALRGDIPKDTSLVTGDYHYAYELINAIKGGDICVAAGAYPEGHIECDDFYKSVEHLKIKQDAGAEFFVSQLFFSNEHYYNLLDKAAAAGITAPITPGIMPMMSKSQISNMIFMCGASLPSAMIKLLHKYENNEEDLLKAGIEYAGNQIRDLLKNGSCGVHLYSMNKPSVAAKLMEYTK